jgi:regulator of RNase E activity RraA
LPDGRPKVSDDLLERLKDVAVEDAWGYLRSHGYYRQYVNFPNGPRDGSWKILHPDKVMTGRVVTAQFMPYRPDLNHYIQTEGKKEGFKLGVVNSTPISILQNGDVWVADGYGKIAGGTLIGGNLGNDIYDHSHRGFIFNGSIRDLAQNRHIKGGYNGWFIGEHASAIRKMSMVYINGPIRIGPVTVLPGDVVLATRSGVIFIPPYLVEGLVATGEFTQLLDEFRFTRGKQGKYDYKNEHFVHGWTDEILKDFKNWLNTHYKTYGMTKGELDNQFKKFKKRVTKRREKK